MIWLFLLLAAVSLYLSVRYVYLWHPIKAATAAVCLVINIGSMVIQVQIEVDDAVEALSGIPSVMNGESQSFTKGMTLNLGESQSSRPGITLNPDESTIIKIPADPGADI